MALLQDLNQLQIKRRLIYKTTNFNKDGISLYHKEERWNIVRNKSKVSQHWKSPRNGKYQNIVKFNNKQKRLKKKYFNDIKKRHYDHFIQSFTKQLDGTQVNLSQGEAELIMVNHLISDRIGGQGKKD